MKTKKYDLIVIGTGSAGSGVAYQCRKAGWKVAIIDSLPFGGTCALRGCDPKKILYGVAEIIERTKDMNKKGMEKEYKINWGDLMKFKNSFTNLIPKGNENAFRKTGIDAYYGQAMFLDKKFLQVGDKKLESKYFVIATGSKPRELKIPGEENVIKSDEFLSLKTLPKEIIFIGGGFVSFELAHIAAMAGSKVKILHRGENPLGQFDPDLVKLILEEFKEKGIEIFTNVPVSKIEKRNNKLIVYSKNKKFTAGMAVHGAGRTPNINALNLEKAGVKFSEKGIKTNQYMQTLNPKIYAGGDCAELGLPLTPVAGLQGRIIANNLLNKTKIKFNNPLTTSVVFTYPPLASVGLTEKEAKEKKVKYQKSFIDTSSWYNPKRIGLKHSAVKILTDKNDKIIGAHLLYPNADEIINLFLFIMKNNLRTDEIKDYLMAYPSSAYDIKYMI